MFRVHDELSLSRCNEITRYAEKQERIFQTSVV